MTFHFNPSTDPGFNLALEEAFLWKAPRGGVFLLWRNAAAVIVGNNQVVADEVDGAYATEQDIPVYRRRTGGGAVYHDAGVVNFTFVVPADGDSPAVLLGRLLPHLGVAGIATDRNDVLVGGRKIVGTAQALANGMRLFHGCILHNADLQTLSRVLTPPPEKLRRHGVPSVRARVANLVEFLPETTEDFMARLARACVQANGWDERPLPPELLADAQTRRLFPESVFCE